MYVYITIGISYMHLLTGHSSRLDIAHRGTLDSRSSHSAGQILEAAQPDSIKVSSLPTQPDTTIASSRESSSGRNGEVPSVWAPSSGENLEVPTVTFDAPTVFVRMNVTKEKELEFPDKSWMWKGRPEGKYFWGVEHGKTVRTGNLYSLFELPIGLGIRI
jgi:hypothetical protein